METREHNTISGKSHDESFFSYFASEKIQYLEILKVLKGDKLGCIFNTVVPDTFSNKIHSNAFRNINSAKKKTPKERTDEAPPISVGTQHYKKHLDSYLDEAERVLPELHDLFNGVDPKDNFFFKFIEEFSQFLKGHDIKLRLAEHKGRPASPFWIRAFDASQEFLISPHDDVPQLLCPKQVGFEIQSVTTIVAVNICLENENNGMLLHYNLEPDDMMRKAHGVENTGYPYPVELLESIQRIELATQKGDFYFLNANNVHAVRADKISEKLRTTMSWFMGLKDDSTVLYWI